MKRIVMVVVLVSVVIFMSSCGMASRIGASLTEYSRICVAGVSYLQFTSGASVEYTPDGKIKTCN